MWEAELRESLARKKPVAAQLSKQDRIALEKQLAKESEVRLQVAAALGRLRRGFALSLCLIASKTELIREYLARLVNHVLTVITMQPATLVADEAFSTYLVSSPPLFLCLCLSRQEVDARNFPFLLRLSRTFVPNDSACSRSLLAFRFSEESTHRSFRKTSELNLSRRSCRECFINCVTSPKRLPSTLERTHTLLPSSARS